MYPTTIQFWTSPSVERWSPVLDFRRSPIAKVSTSVCQYTVHSLRIFNRVEANFGEFTPVLSCSQSSCSVTSVILLCRTWLAVSAQINLNSAVEQDLIQVRSAFPKNLLILCPCLHHNPVNSSFRCIEQNVYKYPDVLQVSFSAFAQ